MRLCHNIEDETSHSGEASQQTGSTPAADSAGALRPSGGQLIVLTYVDDLTIIGTSSQVDWIMSKLRARFALQESETDELSSMLSMEVPALEMIVRLFIHPHLSISLERKSPPSI